MHRGAQRVLVSGKCRPELAIGDLHVADARTLGVVHQVEHVLLLFLRDLEAERSVAARQAQHSAIHADLWSVDAGTAAAESEHCEQQRCSREMPEAIRGVHGHPVVG